MLCKVCELFHYELFATLDIDATWQVIRILHLYTLEVVDGGGGHTSIEYGVIDARNYVFNKEEVLPLVG